MRAVLSVVGTVLVVINLGALLAFALEPTQTPRQAEPRGDGHLRMIPEPLITGVVIPRISLETEVVPAQFVERGGATTWEVPAFKAGHAHYTAGAGERGNAVLVGHVTSLNAGNVFKDLDQVQLADVVRIFSGTRQFDYIVVDVRSVSRADVSVLEATETASISMITCTGIWLPLIWDYTERLVVRAELSSGSRF